MCAGMRKGRRSASRRGFWCNRSTNQARLRRSQVIAENDGNIDNIRMARTAPDFTDVTIDLEVYDLKHLSAIIAQLRAKKVVAKAERVNG